MRILAITMLLAVLMPFAAQAGDAASGVDLILPPKLESPDAPFYRGAKVKLDGRVMNIREVSMPNGVLAEYHPELGAILVSNAKAVSEGKKAQALMDVLSAMEAASIATAAGREAK